MKEKLKAFLEKVKAFVRKVVEKAKAIGAKFWVAVSALLAGAGVGFYQKPSTPKPPAPVPFFSQPAPAKGAKVKAAVKVKAQIPRRPSAPVKKRDYNWPSVR